MPRIMLIVGSVRPSRKGIAVADWVREHLATRAGVEIDVADLKAIDLPFFNETLPPALGKYELPHTIAWAERVRAADGFVLVNPEYNGSFTAPVKNAFDYLVAEWRRKPIGFVAYGSSSGAVRAVAALQPVIAGLGMIRTRTGVEIPNISAAVTDGVFAPTEQQENAVNAMLDDLISLAEGLKALR